MAIIHKKFYLNLAANYIYIYEAKNIKVFIYIFGYLLLTKNVNLVSFSHFSFYLGGGGGGGGGKKKKKKKKKS
jgi:hypothetical protein